MGANDAVNLLLSPALDQVLRHGLPPRSVLGREPPELPRSKDVAVVHLRDPDPVEQLFLVAFAELKDGQPDAIGFGLVNLGAVRVECCQDRLQVLLPEYRSGHSQKLFAGLCHGLLNGWSGWSPPQWPRDTEDERLRLAG